MATLTKGRTFVSGETVTPAKLNDLVDLATVTGIVNADIDAAAAISLSKLNLGSGITSSQIADGAVTGAAGGGKIAASAINSQTVIADALAATDEFLVWDASASALRKVSWSSMQPVGSVLNTVQSVVSTTETITGNIPSDNTIPQQTEGTEIMTATITPQSASNKILVRAVVYISSNAGSWNTAAVFAGSGNDAIASWLGLYGGYDNQVVIEYLHSPATSSAITYKLRVGSDSGTSYINAYGGGSARYGGVARTTLTLQEIKG